MRETALILIMLLSGISTDAQFYEVAFADIGSSQVTEGLFGRAASITGYRIKNYEMMFGLQTTFSSAERNTLSGMAIDLSGDFLVKSFPFNVSLFFRRNPYSDLVKENNFGAMVRKRWDRIELHLGWNSRIYSLSKKAHQGNLPDPDLKINEWRNFIYRGTVWLRPFSKLYPEQWDRHWNFGASFTNYDVFLIQQETNPLLQATFYYKFGPAFSLFGEGWYQGAGMTNLAANYFGFYLRTGFRWQIN